MDMLFLRPSTQEEALALLTQYKQDAMIVAGGTDAVLRLTQKKTAPAVILSLDAIPERHEIAASDDTVRLASGVTYNELLASDVLRLYRGLREAVLHGEPRHPRGGDAGGEYLHGRSCGGLYNYALRARRERRSCVKPRREARSAGCVFRFDLQDHT